MGVAESAKKPTRKALNYAIGQLGENAATDYLYRHGYRILARNYRCKGGELDIIAEHDGHVVFVEVKTRSPRAYFKPEVAVDFKKRARVRRAAEMYLSGYRDPSPSRFDVVSIDLDLNDTIREIRLVQNAFSE